MRISLDGINHCDQQRFVELLGGIFEHSSWAAEAVYRQRPFASREHLLQCMITVVRRSDAATRMELLCAHPQLAGKEASAGTLTDASEREQASAGLNQCSTDELALIESLNRSYLSKFGFPFIIAVTGLNKTQIIEAMKNRLEHSPETEFDTASAEVEKIARIRIDALIDE